MDVAQMTILTAIGVLVICFGIAFAGVKLIDFFMKSMGGHSMNDL